MSNTTSKNHENSLKSLSQLLENMWDDYTKLNPEALRVFNLLSKHNKVENDHIALRTLKTSNLGVQQLAQFFKPLGYVKKGDYEFKEKKLYAEHFENELDPSKPKVFISELEIEKLSSFVQDEMQKINAQVKSHLTHESQFLYSGTHWNKSYDVYKKLATESEYASWFYAHGFRPNHFTVNINALSQFKEVSELNQFLQEHQFKLNSSGGLIKGTPQDYLEQSSTMANEIPVQFTDGSHTIPGCYYEFAKRYPMSNGKLYQGFVAKSADKIFESTNKA